MADVSYTLMIDGAPAEAEVIRAVQQLEVDATLDRASAFRIRFGIGSAADGDWSILSDDLFRPLTPITVHVSVGPGMDETLIHGYVASSRAAFEPEPGRSYLEITGTDATARMNLEEKVRSWPNLSDSDIAAIVFGEYGIVPQIEQTMPYRIELETTTMQRGTDIRFLQRLAARNGYACYMEPQPLTGLESGFFAPLSLEAPSQAILSVRFGTETNVEHFSAHYEMLQPTTARSAGVAIASKSVETAEASSSQETAMGSDDTLGALSPAPVVHPSQTGLNETGELQSHCQGVVDRSTWAVHAEGSLDGASLGKVLRPGKPVNLRGAGSLYSGTYMARRVLHTFSGDRYRQDFELVRNALGLTGSELFVDVGALATAG
jgi:phage protein D